MAADTNEYQKETLRLALELEPEYQLKLLQLKKEARSKPAMKAMYCVLARQLSDEEENSGYLNQALEAQRKKDVEDEVEGVDEEDAPDSAPSPSPPPMIAIAPQTEHKAPNPLPPAPLAPPTRPPSPSSLPPQTAPAPPPPKPPQGAKRQHSPFAPLSRKQTRPNPARCTDDWQCRKCETWNWSFKLHCHGRTKDGRACTWQRDLRDERMKMQEKGPGLTYRWTPAKKQGDWLCKCLFWNRSHWKECNRCVGTVDGKIGIDWNPELPMGIDPAPSMPASAGYWGGGNSNYSTSLQHGYQTASHLGVLGKKKHSWEKKG